MSELIQPDRPQLEEWLQDMHIENHLCDECEGLHVNALQSLEGVVNSRVFLQPTSLLLSTELEVRPMAILPLASELGRMNMEYSNLKIFLDVVDDATPQLVVMSHVLLAAGISQAQFVEFITSTLNATELFAQECLQLDFLFPQLDASMLDASRSVH